MKDESLERLLRVVGDELAGEGFERIERSDRFRRCLDGVCHYFFVGPIERSYGYELEPSVAIRIDRIEEIFHRVSGVDPQYQADSPTIGITLAELAQDRPSFVFQLSSETDTSSLAARLLDAFSRLAVPYYDAYSSVEALDFLLNDDPTARCPHRSLPWLRAATGLVAAQLVGRENYPGLVESYRGKIAKVSRGFYLSRFEALVNLLESEPRR